MNRLRTLRGQLLLWISAPLLALWIISMLIDHDIAKGFVNLNYDRALLDTALDLGRSVREGCSGGIEGLGKRAPRRIAARDLRQR